MLKIIFLIFIMLNTACIGSQEELKYGNRSGADNSLNIEGNGLTDSHKVIFELERIFGQCFGPCPVYKVSIFSNGEVKFTGMKNVRNPGTYNSKISDLDIKKLKEEFDAINFMQLSNKYVMDDNCSHPVLSDSDYARIYYYDGNKSKNILHYTGCYGYGVFDKLLSLESSIDKVANTKQWIK